MHMVNWWSNQSVYMCKLP